MRLIFLTDYPPAPETRPWEILTLLHQLVTHSQGPKLKIEVLCSLGRTHPTPFEVSQYSEKKSWLQSLPPAMLKALRDRVGSDHTVLWISGPKSRRYAKIGSELGYTVVIDAESQTGQSHMTIKERRHWEEQCNWADHIVVSSALGRSRFQKFARETPMTVLPHGVDYAEFAPVRDVPPSPSLLIYGPFDGDGGAKNFKWLMQEVFPRLYAAILSRPQFAPTSTTLPEVTLIGRPPEMTPHQKAALQGKVNLRFFRDDPQKEYLKAAGIVLIPHIQSLGVSSVFRTLEAMAAGRAVVVTGKAIEGLVLSPSYDVVVSDGPDGIASAIIKLAEDGDFRRSIGDRAAETVRSRYDWAIAGNELEQLLQGIFGPSLQKG